MMRKNSFKNSERFIYFLKHAESFYKQAAYSPLEIKPILLFYGMAQLIKACLITRDPHYPSHTSVLAHGVTTRKRKKQNYCFSDDEVKIQRNGLCVHFMKHLFGQSDVVDERYTMKKLLMGVPELSDIFYFQQKERFMTKVEKDKNKIFVPEEVVIDYKMSDSRFVEYMSHHFQWSFAKKMNTGCCLKFHRKTRSHGRRPAYCLTWKRTNITSLLKGAISETSRNDNSLFNFVQRWDDCKV